MTRTWVLCLPCGCPTAHVHADTMARAASLLYGHSGKPPALGCRFVEVEGVSKQQAMAAIQAAGTRRRECRCEATT